MRFFGLSKAHGRRSVPRAFVPLHAVVSTQTRDHAAELLDLSRTGARLSGVCFLSQGEQVTFRAEKVRASGEIIWVEDRECGVEFDTPIAVEEVMRVRALADLLGTVAASENPKS